MTETAALSYQVGVEFRIVIVWAVPVLVTGTPPETVYTTKSVVPLLPDVGQSDLIVNLVIVSPVVAVRTPVKSPLALIGCAAVPPIVV